MKIGIFTECYLPTINGVVTSIESFRKELEKRGHQVFIFAPNHKDAPFLPNVFRVPSIPQPIQRDYPIGLPFLTNLNEEIEKLQLDVIHTQHIFLMGGFGQRVAKKFNLPLVHTYHSLMTMYAEYAPTRFIQNILKKWIIKRARWFCNKTNRVIVPSSPLIPLLQSYGIKGPFEVVPTGIELSQFDDKETGKKEECRKIIAKKYKIPLDKDWLLYLARISFEKRLDLLLEAFLLVKKEFPNCHLIIVGSGPYEKQLKEQISKLGLKNEITACGFKTGQERNQFFKSADIFTFPSPSETQGIVIIESMASGTPVVAIDLFGPKDIIKNGKNGFLTPLDPREFSIAILKLLKDPQLRKKFQKEAKKTALNFSTSNCCQKLIKTYTEVIKEGPRND